MNMKTIDLPERDEMFRRLKAIMDDPHVVERLYPLMLRHAGQRKVALGVVNMVVMSITEYTDELPAPLSDIVMKSAPDFVEALIDDEEVREEAMGIIRSALDPSNV